MTSPPVGFFTSAVFTHHALQWLWNYTVEFHPPRWWLAGRWHAVKPQQLVYAPLAVSYTHLTLPTSDLV